MPKFLYILVSVILSPLTTWSQYRERFNLRRPLGFINPSIPVNVRVVWGEFVFRFYPLTLGHRTPFSASPD
jgi:hypothetical protein